MKFLLRLGICCFSLLFLSTFKSYKTYEFDYIIEYKHQLCHVEHPSVFYLTNSRDNEYWASLTVVNSETYRLKFFKHNSLNLIKYLDKDEFFDSKNIEMSRYKGFKVKNKKSRRKDYFLNQPETMEFGQMCKRYLFSSVNHHKQDLDVQFYIEPNTEFHLPILFFGSAFKKWQKEKSIPNGIFREMYFVNKEKGITESHLYLAGYRRHHKKITVKF